MLQLVNSETARSISELRYDPSFWKRRLEKLLKIKISDKILANWENAYKIVTKNGTNQLLFSDNIAFVDIALSVENSKLPVENSLLRVNPNSTGKWGAHKGGAIAEAAASGNLQILERLLKDPRVIPNMDHNLAIRSAAKNGHLNVVEILLKYDRIDPSDDNNYAIIEASKNGYERIVEKLLDDTRVDPSAKSNEAIRSASLDGHTKIVKRLLQEPRVNPSDNENASLRNAVYNGYPEIVKLLLEDRRVDPSFDDNSAIRVAAKRETYE
jgi:ankyrin repeat protein